MTKWQEFPLRPPGQPWHGLNTRGGAIDPGAGHLEDGSFNQVINEADTLEKRKGLIRGLEERFSGVVCGLFRYTDNCGREWLLVADDTSILIRQPFAVPVFETSDAYPNDGFETDLDLTNWSFSGSSPDELETANGSLVMTAAADITPEQVISPAVLLQWFKAATNPSYFTQIQYSFDTTSNTEQRVGIHHKRNAATDAHLEAIVVFGFGVYFVRVDLVTLGEGAVTVREELLRADLGGANLATGFLRIDFNAQTFVVTLTVTPAGGTPIAQSSTITQLKASNLGDRTGLGLSRNDNTAPLPSFGILQVIGGPI